MAEINYIEKPIQEELRRRELITGRIKDAVPIPGSSTPASLQDYMSKVPYAVMSTNAKDSGNNIALSAGEVHSQKSENIIDFALSYAGLAKDSVKTRKMFWGFDSSGMGGYRATDSMGSRFQGSDVGIRPVGGIKSITCEYLTTQGLFGAGRMATISWSAPSLESLQQYEIFLTPGFEVALQWGWVSGNAKLDNDQGFIVITDNGIAIDQELFQAPNKKISLSNGNMDALGGMIKDFSMKLRDDGGFDCTTDIIGIGSMGQGASGAEDAEGGLGMVLPKNFRAQLEDIKKGFQTTFQKLSMQDITKGAVTVEDLFKGFGGYNEPSEEEIMATQDHMLNALLNLDAIAESYITEEDLVETVQLVGADGVVGYQAHETTTDSLGNKKEPPTAGTNQKSGNTATYGSTNPMGTDLTNLGGGLFGCWIAAEIYGGWYEPKTILARKFVNSDEFPKWLYNLYMKYGKEIANFIRKYKFIKPILKPIFDIFVKRGKRYEL
jgi:hypothetical protein